MQTMMTMENSAEIQLAMVFETETGEVNVLDGERAVGNGATGFLALGAHDEREHALLAQAISTGHLHDGELATIEARGRAELACLREELQELLGELSAFVRRMNGTGAWKRIAA